MITVSVEDVWKYFGDFPALRGITLEVHQGTCTAILGRNGAGKTTLLRILAGLSRPARGRVLVLGRDPRDTALRQALGFLGHGIGVYEELSAEENLQLFAGLYRLRDANQRVKDWLEKTGLYAVRHGPVREYSRGMRQRLALARALLHDPQVILLDEPFTALDDRAVAFLQSVLRERLGQGATILMSTHQLREALELATHVALIHRGKVLFHGMRTEAMLADVGWLYREYARE